MKKFYSLLFIFICCTAAEAQFTTGNIVISELTASSTTGSTLDIKEYLPSTAGQTSPVHSFTLNQTAGALPLFSVLGQSELSHRLSLSLDGQYIITGGYNGAPTLPNRTTAGALALLPRTIAKIDASRAVSYSSNTDPWDSNAIIRDVLTIDGTKFWTACHFNPLRYILGELPGSATASTSFNFVTGAHNATGLVKKTDGTVLVISFDNTASGPANFLWSPVDTATGVVAAGTPVAYQPAGATTLKANSFVFLDLDATQNWNGTGYDVLYVSHYNAYADRGIYKYYWDNISGTWNLAGAKVADTAGGFQTMTAIKKAGGGVTIYALTGGGQTGGNRLTTFDDTAAYNAAMSIGTTYKTLATAEATKVFKGIAMAPVASPMSVVENELDSKFQVWPNPSQGEINILNNQDQGATSTIEITTVTGQIVTSQKLNAGATTTIKTNGWSAGIYFLKATSNGAQTTKKLIIQ